MEEIRIEVAGVCIMLRSDYPEFISKVREDYSLFLSDSPPSLTLDITLTEKPYVNNSSWAGLTITDDALLLTDDYLDSSIDRNLVSGSALLSRNGLTIGLSTLLRNMFTLRLLMYDDSVILHAAALLKGSGVYIFMGHSGSGKTTVSGLSDHCTVLSDDMVIIKRMNGAYRVYPAPFWLDLQRGDRENRGYDIAGIYTLKQDKTTYIKNIPPAQAMADIFTIPHIPSELQPFQKMFDIFSSILCEHGLNELHFKKDKSFWRYIDEQQHIS